MENVLNFRIFSWFPIIGLLLLDAGSVIDSKPIPTTHIIMLITLFVVIIVSSVGIQRAKKSGLYSETEL